MPTFVIVNKMYLTIENPDHLCYEADQVIPNRFGYIFDPAFNMFVHAQVPEGMEPDCIRAIRVEPYTETIQTSHVDEETGETIITTSTVDHPASFQIVVHEAKLQRKRAIQWNALRDERNRRLTLSDWTQLPDAQLKFSEQQKEEWRVYRQTLRDMPTTTVHPGKPQWPVEPGYVPPQPIPEVPEEPLVLQPEFIPPPPVVEPVVDPEPPVEEIVVPTPQEILAGGETTPVVNETPVDQVTN